MNILNQKIGLVQEQQNVDNIIIIYNKFKSMLQSIPSQIEIMNKKTFLNQFKYVTKHDMSEPEKV
jgi:F-type H+-transporting ATPase subunit gamma